MRDIFIGREEEVNTLRKRVNAFIQGYRQNIAILGKENTGKSYLVEYFLKTYRPKNLQAVYLDLQYTDYNSFNTNILYLLLSGYAKKDPAAEGSIENKLEAIENTISEIHPALPETAEKIKEILAKKEKVGFELLTSITDSFIKETGVCLLWILKDFTKLSGFSKKMLSQLSKYIMGQKNIMYIFISRDVKEAEKMLSEELNLLFGNFEKIYLGEFSTSEAQKFIKIKLERIDTMAERFLINISGLSPFYLDLLTSCFSRNGSVKNIDYLGFLKSLSSCLADKSSPLYNILQGRLARLEEKFKNAREIDKCLISIAEGKRHKGEIGNELQIDSKSATRVLNKLVEEGVISKNGNVYYFSDKLFGFWISTVLKTKLNCPYCYEEDAKEILFRYLEKAFAAFREENTRNNLDKILSLVKMFKDENIKVNSKKMLLPAIKRLRVVDSYHKTMKFIIGEGTEYLILSFKESAPQEEDIQEFINRCRYFKGRKLRKVFLSLENVSDNCRLLAKVNHVFLWEKKDINLLMRIYNQPPII